jgi:hypothetical protein
MKAIGVMFAATALSTSAMAQVTGFVQLRQAQRIESIDCQAVSACTTMVQEALGELLFEKRLNDQWSGSLRVEAGYDNAVSDDRLSVREAFVDWAPASTTSVKLGRQVLTWGVSDYLYVNDIFPKNYDSFFTGGGFDRMKVPVDAARVQWHAGSVDVEAVAARSKADTSPDAARFSAMTVPSMAVAVDEDDRADLALKVSGHAGGWDLAGYAASFRSREQRQFMDGSGLRIDRPRLRHLGASATGNAVGGLIWLEGAIRDAGDERPMTVNRHFLGSSAKLIAGYSREIGTDLTASAQLQLEAATSRQHYLDSLAPGLRPLKAISSTLHLRVHGSWMNQTLGGGAQVFLGNEGDSHFNPFVSWSPADGWTVEGGANLFNGRSDTRYGALQDDSNVYVLGRYSF